MLFSKRGLQVAIMASSLEVGKLVLTTVVYRYWDILSKLLKSYMVSAIMILMIITSAGIFGYLSDTYQRTKGNYDIVDKEVQILTNRKQLLSTEYSRFETRLNNLVQNRTTIESRLDNLYQTGAISSAKRVEQSIKIQDNQIEGLNKNLSTISDSISSIEKLVIEKQSVNISGELGPLMYISTAFNTDMDSVVKIFILVLIFVFDPLALSLLISANTIYSKSHMNNKVEWTHAFNKKKNDDIVTFDVSDDVIDKPSEASHIDTNMSNTIEQPTPQTHLTEEITQPVENTKSPRWKWKTSNWRD